MWNGIRILLSNDNLMLKNGSNDEKRSCWYLNSNKHCNVKLLWQIKGSDCLPKKKTSNLTSTAIPLLCICWCFRSWLARPNEAWQSSSLHLNKMHKHTHAWNHLVHPQLQEQCFNAHATRTEMHSTTHWATLTQLHNTAMRTCPARIHSCAMHQTGARQSLATHKRESFFLTLHCRRSSSYPLGSARIAHPRIPLSHKAAVWGESQNSFQLTSMMFLKTPLYTQ